MTRGTKSRPVNSTGKGSAAHKPYLVSVPPTSVAPVKTTVKTNYGKGQK